MPQRHLVFLCSLLLSSLLYADTTNRMADKPIIGPAANFIVNGQAHFRARIDTGASRTSINASNIKVIDSSDKMLDNVGKQIEFNITNRKGETARQRAEIKKVIFIRTPQGREARYLVPLKLTWKGVTSQIDANLRDRSHMKYKLLIGRDWLDTNANVDVKPKANVDSTPKPTIGEVANFTLENEAEFEARVDTGAASTSINAHNIQIANESSRMLDNIGKDISFDIINADGESTTIHTTIAKVVAVKNALGTEYRYKAPLKIQWNGEDEILNINLRNRSGLTYMLLIGRDWIGPNAIVEIDE